MKKSLVLNIVFIFITGLVHTGNPTSQPRPAKPLSYALPQPTFEANREPIKVVFGSAQISPIVSPAESQPSCKPGINAQPMGDPLQVVGINLNQPASCFSINIAAKVSATVNLTVKPLDLGYQNIIFVRQAQGLQSPDLLPIPFESSAVPVLPSLAFVFIIGVLAFKKKVVEKFVEFKLRNKSDFSVYRMRILRC